MPGVAASRQVACVATCVVLGCDGLCGHGQSGGFLLVVGGDHVDEAGADAFVEETASPDLPFVVLLSEGGVGAAAHFLVEPLLIGIGPRRGAAVSDGPLPRPAPPTRAWAFPRIRLSAGSCRGFML